MLVPSAKMPALHMRVVIAIPAYNEEKILAETVRTVADFVTKSIPHHNTSIVIADNASTDKTSRIGRQLATELPGVHYLHTPERGKGIAIRRAWQSQEADVYVFMDADLATSLDALPALIDTVAQGSAPIAIGSRNHTHSQIHRTRLRRFFSFGYRVLTRILLGTRIHDIPCGFKAVSREVIERIMPTVKDNSWFFDSELVLRAEKAGMTIHEIPITWHDIRTRVSRVQVIRVSLDYLRRIIRLRAEFRKLNTPTSSIAFTDRIFDFKKDSKVFLILVALVALFYGSTLKNGFIHDDYGQLLSNPTVQSIKGIPKAFTSCIWATENGTCQGSSYYRPLQNISYILTWTISSSAGFFHFINLVYLAIASFAIFSLIRLISSNQKLALLTAILFIAHPINSESVNWIASVPELLMAIFIPLTIFSFVQYRVTDNEKYLVRSLLFYAMGLCSKEPAALTPLLLAAIDLTWFRKRIRQLFWAIDGLPYYLYAIALTIYFFARTLVLGGFGVNAGTVGYHGIFTTQEHLNAFFTLFARYIQKIFYPLPSLFYYPFEKSASLQSPLFLFGVSALVVIMLIIGALLYRKKYLPALGILWIGIYLAPVLLFADKIGENVFTERYLFIPSIGFALVLASLVTTWWDKKLVRNISLTLLTVAVGLSWHAIQIRNRQWVNNETLYEDTLTKNPQAAGIRFNRANDNLHMGNTDFAEREFKTVIANNPDWSDIYKAYNNLGEIERKRGNKNEAIQYYKKAVEISKGRRLDPLTNLAGMYYEQKKTLLALTATCRATQLTTEKEIHNNLDNLISSVTDAKKKHPVQVFWDLTHGEAFSKSSEHTVVFLNGGCDASGCYLVFQPPQDPHDPEILLPFLVFASAKEDDVIPLELREVRVDRSANTIVVMMDVHKKQNHMTFFFPSCNGEYYTADVTFTPSSR